MRDFSFQGRIYLGENLQGAKPGDLTWVGDQSSCELNLNTENVDRTETYSGQRLQSARLRTATTVELNLVLRYFNVHNLQLGLYAKPNNVVSGSVSNEELPDDLVAGSRVVLAKPSGVSSLVLTDSAMDPETVNTDHYSHANGVIQILDTTGYEQPFVAAYSHTEFASLPLFTAQPPERYLFLDGINTVSGDRIHAHLYRVQFNPIESLGFINPEFGELNITGTALFDPDAAENEDLGGFGRLEFPTAAAA